MTEERMESLTLDQLRQVARFQGYAWTDAEIDRLRQQIERGLGLVEKLGALISREVEPATQYRMF
jgi:Asp-tRNA(Asn)/Glu-tRNA(Gln) amidotransferase C subunit